MKLWFNRGCSFHDEILIVIENTMWTWCDAMTPILFPLELPPGDRSYCCFCVRKWAKVATRIVFRSLNVTQRRRSKLRFAMLESKWARPIYKKRVVDALELINKWLFLMTNKVISKICTVITCSLWIWKFVQMKTDRPDVTNRKSSIFYLEVCKYLHSVHKETLNLAKKLPDGKRWRRRHMQGPVSGLGSSDKRRQIWGHGSTWNPNKIFVTNSSEIGYLEKANIVCLLSR